MKSMILLVLGLLTTSVFARTYSFRSESVTIPEKGPADPSFIHVEGVEGQITNIIIKLDDFNHYYASETMVAVSNPDGWTSLIWARPQCRMTYAELVIRDDAEKALSDDCNSSQTFSGGKTPYLAGHNDNDSYAFTIPIAPDRPYLDNLEGLILDNVNGRWILWAEDFFNGDGGSINYWEIIFETDEPEPEPEPEPEV